MKKFLISLLAILIIGISGFMLYQILTGNNITFSRMKTRTSGSANVDIAIPISQTNFQTFQVPLSSMEPGDTFLYTFNVTNKDSLNRISEISMDYTIEVQRSTNIPLTIEIQKEDDPTNILTNLTSPTYTLNYGTEQIDNYKLIVTWDINDNDYRYADLIEILSININSIQKID